MKNMSKAMVAGLEGLAIIGVGVVLMGVLMWGVILA